MTTTAAAAGRGCPSHAHDGAVWRSARELMRRPPRSGGVVGRRKGAQLKEVGSALPPCASLMGEGGEAVSPPSKKQGEKEKEKAFPAFTCFDLHCKGGA